ncbi:MAG TPA: hypothetical protein GXX36_11120 [Clostridiaceae bacterium]|nr:hypothetical protein [Clostridiaceae bacterium]
MVIFGGSLIQKRIYASIGSNGDVMYLTVLISFKKILNLGYYNNKPLFLTDDSFILAGFNKTNRKAALGIE